MRVGDLVVYYDGFNEDDRLGLVTEIRHWVDQGAPDRNFGTDIAVLWQDGDHQLYGEWELRVVDEHR